MAGVNVSIPPTPPPPGLPPSISIIHSFLPKGQIQEVDGFPLGKGILLHGTVGSATPVAIGKVKEHEEEGGAAGAGAGGGAGGGGAGGETAGAAMVQEKGEEEEKQSEGGRFQARSPATRPRKVMACLG